MRRKHPSVDYGKMGVPETWPTKPQLPIKTPSPSSAFFRSSAIATFLASRMASSTSSRSTRIALKRCTSVSSSNCSGRFWFGFTFASSEGSMDPIFGKSLGSSKWPFFGCFKWLPFGWSKGWKDWRRVECTGWTTAQSENEKLCETATHLCASRHCNLKSSNDLKMWQECLANSLHRIRIHLRYFLYSHSESLLTLQLCQYLLIKSPGFHCCPFWMAVRLPGSFVHIVLAKEWRRKTL